MLLTYILYNSILIIACLFAYFAEHGNIRLFRLFCRSFAVLASKFPPALRLGNERHFRLFCRFIVFLALWIPASLRYGVGGDFFSYVDMFNGVSPLTVEIGWVILNRALRFVGLSSQWVFVCSAFLIYFPLCFIIKRKNFFYSILFYLILEFYFSSFNTIRQWIAVSFLIGAVTALEYKKNVRFFIWVVLASLFHQSALFVLSFFPLKYVKFKQNITPIIITVFGIVLLAKLNFLEIALSVAKTLNHKYAIYELTKFATMKGRIDTGLGFFAKILPSLFILFLLPQITKKYPQKAFAANLSIVSVLLYFLSAQYHIMIRARSLFDFVQILMIGFAIQAAGKYKKIIAIVIICSNLIVFQYDRRPYHSVFSNFTEETQVIHKDE